jgi:anti-sigma B factor antagonist
MSLEIKERQAGSITVLEVSGRLTLGEDSKVLTEKLQNLIAAGCSAFLLECSKVSAIDSQGLSALVRSVVSVRKRGGKIKLMNTSPRLHYVLEITSLLKVIESFDNEDAAVRSF